MGLVSEVIPGLFNGVSQQPTTVRLPTQGEVQENYDSNLVTGLTSRVPSEHLAFLGYGSLIGNDAYVHTINRGDSERYIVVIVSGDLKVFDITGVEKTVIFPNGKGYLTNSTPSQGFRVVTVADYSFIINNNVTVTMDSATGPGSLLGSKQLFSDLPATPTLGDIWEIAGDPTNRFDNYYVKRDVGVWVEDTKPGLQNKFSASTMPHQLVRNPNGTFTFQQGTWDDRAVGDVDSSPAPSFIGRKLRDIFFHRNRLGLVSDENVIFSRAGEFFNFWRETVLDVLDSDPIDVSVAHTKVSNIHSAVPYNKSLMLFSTQTQFVLSGGDALTPKSVKIDQTTEFETSDRVRPVSAGPNVYFVVERGGYAGFKEYYVDDTTSTNDASDITKHVPTYIPSGVFKVAASSNEDILFTVTEGERNAIYVYRYYWQGTEKKQSSWSKWTFSNTDTILNVDVIGTTLYVLIKRTAGIYLEKMDFRVLRQDSVGYLVGLDRRVILTGVYSAITNKTTFTFPYDDPGTLSIVLGSAFGSESGSLLDTLKVSDGVYTAVGDYTAGTVFGGRGYVSRYQLSEQHVKAQGGTSVLSGKIMLRFLTVDYVNTGHYSIRVTPTGRSAYDNYYPYRVLGTGSIILSKPNILKGRAKVPILANSSEVKIELINDKPMPCSFQSLEWSGFYVKHTQTI